MVFYRFPLMMRYDTLPASKRIMAGSAEAVLKKSIFQAAD